MRNAHLNGADAEAWAGLSADCAWQALATAEWGAERARNMGAAGVGYTAHSVSCLERFVFKWVRVVRLHEESVSATRCVCLIFLLGLQPVNPKSRPRLFGPTRLRKVWVCPVFSNESTGTPRGAYPLVSVHITVTPHRSTHCESDCSCLRKRRSKPATLCQRIRP